jgi:hypothetical protein
MDLPIPAWANRSTPVHALRKRRPDITRSGKRPYPKESWIGNYKVCEQRAVPPYSGKRQGKRFDENNGGRNTRGFHSAKTARILVSAIRDFWDWFTTADCYSQQQPRRNACRLKRRLRKQSMISSPRLQIKVNLQICGADHLLIDIQEPKIKISPTRALLVG